MKSEIIQPDSLPEEQGNQQLYSEIYTEKPGVKSLVPVKTEKKAEMNFLYFAVIHWSL